MFLLPPCQNMPQKNPFQFKLNTYKNLRAACLVFPITPATLFTVVVVLHTDTPKPGKIIHTKVTFHWINYHIKLMQLKYHLVQLKTI